MCPHEEKNARDDKNHPAAERALVEMAERFRSLVESTSDWIWEVDRSGAHVYSNRAAEATLGYSVEKDVLGAPSFEIMHPEDAERWRIKFKQCIEEGVGWKNERIRWVDRNGGIRHAESSATPVFDESGEVLGFRGIDRDVTEAVTAEQALREKENRMQSIFRAAPVGIGVVVDRVFTEVNETLCAMVGFASGELLGQDARMLYVDDREYQDVGIEKYRQIRESGKGTVETRWKCKDGRVIDVLLSSTPFDFQDLTRGVTFTALDITERKRLEAKVNQAQKMEAIGQLAGGVAHDFNNFLGAILMRTEMAREEIPVVDPIYSHLEDIQMAAERCARLTQQLLAVARKQTVTPQVVDLNEAIGGLLPMLARLMGEDITLEFRPEEASWCVELDPGQVDQVLTNLCLNARDAIPGAGSVIIETANVNLSEEDAAGLELEPGAYIQLSVEDNGSGISEEDRSRVFEPFFTTKPAGKGTGLGLATVFGIVTQNHGSIQLCSEVQKGTRFRILFPRCEKEKSRIPLKRLHVPRGKGETVLVVDDDASVLESVRISLTSLGYEVLTAQGPQQALRLVEALNRPVDVVLTDVVMPQMNGRQLVERMRELRPGIKSMFMSGYSDDMVTLRGDLQSGVGILHKPFRKENLADAIRAVLDEP